MVIRMTWELIGWIFVLLSCLEELCLPACPRGTANRQSVNAGDNNNKMIGREILPGISPRESSKRLLHPRYTNRFDHLAHCAIKPDQCGPRDNIMPDVEFFDFRYTNNRANVAISQAMSRRDLQPDFCR